MEHRELNERYSKIASDLIKTEDVLSDIRQSEVTILYLSSDKEKKSKGRNILGECEKIPDKYKWSIPADFTITVFEPSAATLSDEQMRILLLHELMHVGIKFLEDGTEQYSIIPHDIEDFKSIIQKYGLDWNEPEWREIDAEEDE